MDSFVFPGDYIAQIQSDTLNQSTGYNPSILDTLQASSVSECISYLKQKYDISKAFNDTVKHVPSNTYKAGNTVYLDASAYDATKTYTVNSQCLQAGNIYSCSTAITIPEAFNINHWSLLGVQYNLYYALIPHPIFDYKNVYKVGDLVFWNDKTYACKLKTQILDHEALLQVGISGANPIVNIFPDDSEKGIQYWGMGVDYAIPSNTQITNTAYWTKGDNRDQKLVEVCVNIILYKAHQRIAPRNIPEIRIINYRGEQQDREIRGQRVLYPTYCALGWLQAASIGNDITPDLPLLQPSQGKRILFGGRQKNINSY